MNETMATRTLSIIDEALTKVSAVKHISHEMAGIGSILGSDKKYVVFAHMTVGFATMVDIDLCVSSRHMFDEKGRLEYAICYRGDNPDKPCCKICRMMHLECIFPTHLADCIASTISQDIEALLLYDVRKRY